MKLFHQPKSKRIKKAFQLFLSFLVNNELLRMQRRGVYGSDCEATGNVHAHLAK
jgi:hypothetical protein